MKKCSRAVIFAATIADAEFAVSYIKSNPKTDVKVVTPTLSAQWYLKNNGIYAFDYADLMYNNRNYYSESLKKIYQESDRICSYFRKHFSSLVAFDIKIVDVLQIILQAEFMEVLYVYNAYRTIQSAWKPNVLFFPQHAKTQTSGWSATHFFLASLISDFFVQEGSCIYFNSGENPKTFDFSTLKYVLKSPQYILKCLGGVSIRMLRKQTLQRKHIDRLADVLLFSGGRNLHFNHRIFTLLKSNSEKLRIIPVSAPNIAADEWLLYTSDIDHVSINLFLTDLLKRQADNLSRKIYEKAEIIFSNSDKAKGFFPKKYPESVRKALQYKAYITLTAHIQKVVRQAASAQKAIEVTKPKLMITTHDPGPSALPFVYAAKQRKISTLVLLHGYHDVNHGANHESDYIAVWGKLLKQKFVRNLGKKSETVISLGYPFLDDFFRNKRAFWQKKVHYQKPQSISLLLTVYQLDEAAISRFIISFFQTLHKYQLCNIPLRFRTHPGQSIIGIEQLANYYGVSVEINKPMTIEQFIQKSDFVVCWDTSAILWAMLFGKPLFYTTPWWGEGYIPAKKYHAAWVPHNVDDILKKYCDLQKNPSLVKNLHPGQKKMLTDALGILDGTSSQKHIELIEKLVKKAI